jgi:hypothetical protein
MHVTVRDLLARRTCDVKAAGIHNVQWQMHTAKFCQCADSDMEKAQLLECDYGNAVASKCFGSTCFRVAGDATRRAAPFKTEHAHCNGDESSH